MEPWNHTSYTNSINYSILRGSHDSWMRDENDKNVGLAHTRTAINKTIVNLNIIASWTWIFPPLFAGRLKRRLNLILFGMPCIFYRFFRYSLEYGFYEIKHVMMPAKRLVHWPAVTVACDGGRQYVYVSPRKRSCSRFARIFHMTFSIMFQFIL